MSNYLNIFPLASLSSVRVINLGSTTPKFGGTVNLTYFSNLSAFYGGNNNITGLSGYSNLNNLNVLSFLGGNTLSFNLSSLPTNLKILEITGSGANQNRIFGNMISIPRNLTFYRVEGNNTTSGNLEDLPSTLTSYTNIGSLTLGSAQTVTGNISALPAMIKFDCQGRNTTTGDISSLKVGMWQYINVGLNTTTGNIEFLPNAMYYYDNRGLNTCYGNLTGLPPGIRTFVSGGNSEGLYYYDGRVLGYGTYFPFSLANEMRNISLTPGVGRRQMQDYELATLLVDLTAINNWDPNPSLRTFTANLRNPSISIASFPLAYQAYQYLVNVKGVAVSVNFVP